MSEKAVPELSIIVPVYKVEKYLPKCIDSILAQTVTDFELILIDDGSPDRCGAICDEYAAKDSRIIVIHQENKGVSAARNAGLDVAKGTYVGFVDSDDWIEPEMYEYLIGACKTSHTSVSICGVRYYSDSGAELRTDLNKKEMLSKDELLKALYGKPNPIGGGCVNKLFKRESISGVRFPTQVKMAEDWVFLFSCFNVIERAFHGDFIGYNIVERSDSATRINEADACYDILFGGKSSLSLLLLARAYSTDLEKIAIDKYLDDCLRYSNIIRQYGKKSGASYRFKFLRIRFQMLKRMPRIIVKKMLPKEKIRGYLYSMFRT